MATLTNAFASGCANGKALIVTATSSGSAQTVDTAINSGASYDLYDLWAAVYEDSTTEYQLYVILPESGGTVAVPVTVQGRNGFYPILSGIRLGGAASLDIKVYASSASKIVVLCNPTNVA